MDDNIIQQGQIRRTIETYFTEEKIYFDKEIRVRSLFLIDEVKKDREEEGGKGIYARMFEECYE